MVYYYVVFPIDEWEVCSYAKYMPNVQFQVINWGGAINIHKSRMR